MVEDASLFELVSLCLFSGFCFMLLASQNEGSDPKPPMICPQAVCQAELISSRCRCFLRLRSKLVFFLPPLDMLSCASSAASSHIVDNSSRKACITLVSALIHHIIKFSWVISGSFSSFVRRSSGLPSRALSEPPANDCSSSDEYGHQDCDDHACHPTSPLLFV